MRIMTLIAVLGSFVWVGIVSNNASACDTVGTCKGIAFCINKLDGGNAPFSQAISKAVSDGDGNGIGVDTAACQHKFGQGNWDALSAGCTNPDYVALGKKAIKGSTACD